MAEIRDLGRAKATFETLCRMLDKDEWHYQKDEKEMSIDCTARGEDLPIDISIKVDVDRMVIVLFSAIPFAIQEDKRLDAAIAISAVNNILVDGSFDYNVISGRIIFRMTNCFIESDIGEEAFDYMIYSACHMIDEYNDKFLMLSKGILSIEKFIEVM